MNSRPHTTLTPTRLSALALAWLAGCAAPLPEDTEPEPATDTTGLSHETTLGSVSISSSGDNVTSAGIELIDDGDEQDFLVTLAPIVNPVTNRPYGATDADRFRVASEARASGGAVTAAVTVKGADTPAVLCEASLEFGEGTASGADVAFLVDTTGSMGNAVTGIADSIEDFARELDEAGLGVRFAFVTFGDAYDTKRAIASDYSTGTGSDEPPSMDFVERPLLDFTSSLEDFSAFVDEVRTSVGYGAGGGAAPENYYGVSTAMNAKQSPTLNGASAPLSRRTGVPYYQVLVGDECSHTEERPGPTFDTPWLPPSASALPALLGDGSVTVHTVEREGFNPDWCDLEQLTLTELSQATGGAQLTFPETGIVDLSALELADFITNFWLVEIDSNCIDEDASEVELELAVTVNDGAAARTQTFTFAMVLDTATSTP